MEWHGCFWDGCHKDIISGSVSTLFLPYNTGEKECCIHCSFSILHRRDLVDIHYFPPILYGRDFVEVPLFSSYIHNIGRNSVALPLFVSYIYRRAACNLIPTRHQVIINLTQGIVLKQSELQQLQSINMLATYFSSSSDLFCCSALARAMAPLSVRLLW